MIYTSQSSFEHEQDMPVGILLTNLGTPDAPDRASLRRYLKEFLSDPRVVEQPRWLWWPILHGIILNIRPARSAAAYRSIWTDDGSPLMVHSLAQLAGFRKRLGEGVRVELAMRYGRPSIAEGLRALREQGCRRLLILPLYPQYSATTSGSTFDAVADELKRWRRVPGLRFVDSYHDHPGYIAALAASVREHWQNHGRAERLLMSFHGIPERYFRNGDPYPCLCRVTARLLAESLDLGEDDWQVSFQSRFGREPWVKPYTDETLRSWAKEGVRRVDVICPGFSADCLETLEEIAVENRDVFIEAGGTELRYIPALNGRTDHVQALSDIALGHLTGWVDG